MNKKIELVVDRLYWIARALKVPLCVTDHCGPKFPRVPNNNIIIARVAELLKFKRRLSQKRTVVGGDRLVISADGFIISIHIDPEWMTNDYW